MKIQEEPSLTKDYFDTLKNIKDKIQSSQIKAALAVNQELLKLYWEIGTTISEKQKEKGWGSKTVEKLAQDLKNAFPGVKGFSLTNVKYMCQFAEEYPDFPISQQLVGQIPWGHNVILIQKVKDKSERLWYVQKTLENGWSRNSLSIWIDSDLYRREGKALTNFNNSLPKPQSDLAKQTLKDPYSFEFLSLRKDYDEKELEEGLMDHIQKFLLELGQGFAFVGRQYRLEVANSEYFIDLLFYHLDLRCYYVIELKATDFKPDYTGKLNFYLSAVDDLIKKPEDNPIIGVLICKGKDDAKVEYALRNVNSPIGIASYETKIVKSLPENLKSSLPSVEEIEAEINRGANDKT